MARTLHLTSPELSGIDVTNLQKMLNNNTFGDFYKSDEYDGVYGPITAQAVFRAKYRLGYALNKDQLEEGESLLVDYVAGDTFRKYLTAKVPLTDAMKARRKARAVVTATPFKVKAFGIAMQQLGVKENPPGSNHVLFSHWYGEKHNGNPNSFIGPWCFMFVSWCYTRAGLPMFYAWCPAGVAHAREGVNGWALTSNPEKGDVVFFDWDGGVADHVGIFDKWIDRAAGTFMSVEGNTSAGNNSNGGQVQHRSRRLRDVECFARYSGKPVR